MISSTIFCVDELPNVQRFPHMILNSIFCRDKFPKVPKYAYDDRLTKLTVLVLSGTNDVGEKYHDNILWACVQRGGGTIGSVVPQRQL